MYACAFSTSLTSTTKIVPKVPQVSYKYTIRRLDSKLAVQYTAQRRPVGENKKILISIRICFLLSLIVRTEAIINQTL